MPKKSETSDKVHSAADTLLAQGKRPTQQAVRDLIGTGSITTINHALNLWWANLAKRLNRQSDHPALPDPVITAASKLWDQAVVYAHASLDSQRVALAQEYEQQQLSDNQQLLAVQSQQLTAQSQNSRLLESNEQLLEQQHTLTRKIHELESDLIKTTAQHDELNRTNKQQQILLDNQAQPSQIENSEAFFQAKIELKVNEVLISDLKTNLNAEHNKCITLQQQLFDQEKSYLKQVHRLELVIAQQDAKYNNVLQRLDKYESTAS